MGTNVSFHKWHYKTEYEERSQVFPDGCRDILIVQKKGQPPQVSLTQFDLRPRNVLLPAGTKITGYRLRPGATVSPTVQNAITLQPADADQILSDTLGGLGDLDFAIMDLSLSGSTLQAVSKNLGVSIRTMQRRFHALGLPPPDYWRLLVRARQAVALLSTPTSLAEIAYESGFSDQAHMTREFVRWFGKPPVQLREDTDLIDQLCQPALDNWTGEQISTK